MKELREHVALSTEVDLSERASEDFVRRVASRLAPGLERSVGPVLWTSGETRGIDWTAEGFFEGALVVVCLRPTSREVSLLVDPRIAPPAEPLSKSTTMLMLGILGTSAAVGLITRSVWWAVSLFIGTMAAWISADVVRQERRKKRATAAFDGAVWRRRFQDAVATTTTFR